MTPTSYFFDWQDLQGQSAHAHLKLNCQLDLAFGMQAQTYLETVGSLHRVQPADGAPTIGVTTDVDADDLPRT